MDIRQAGVKYRMATHREDTPSPQLGDLPRNRNQDDFPTDFFVCAHCTRSMENAFPFYDWNSDACCSEDCANDRECEQDLN